jgi:P-type Na+/K+ transporter
MGKKIPSIEAVNYTEQPFLLSVDELVQHLETNQDVGFSNAQVQQYRLKYGENKLKGEGAVKWYSLLVKQISNAMVLVSSFSAHSSLHSLMFPAGPCPCHGSILRRDGLH